MNKILFPFVFCFRSFGMKAQTLYDEATQDLANIMCNCINNSFSSLDDVMAYKSGEKQLECENCIEISGTALESKYASLKADENYSEQTFYVHVIEKLSKTEGCELAYTLMQMSLTEPATGESEEY